MVESQPSKLLVAGSIPVSRSSSCRPHRDQRCARVAGRDRGACLEHETEEQRRQTGCIAVEPNDTRRCSSVVERVLGKDEVTGSSPVIGSTMTAIRDRWSVDGEVREVRLRQATHGVAPPERSWAPGPGE